VKSVLIDDVEEVDEVEDPGQGGHDGQSSGGFDDSAMQQLVPEVGVVPSETTHA